MNKNIAYQKETVSIDGLQSSFWKAGTGSKLIIFLHGWGGNKDSWEKLVKELTKMELDREYTFVSLDFPGFGESKEPDQGWCVKDYAKWTEKVLSLLVENYGPGSVNTLIVHSFGGRVLFKMLSQGFGLKDGLRPEKVVLIAAAGIKPSKTLRIVVAGLAAKFGKKVLSWPILRRLAPLAQKILYKVLRTHDYEKSSGVMRETFIKVIDEDLKTVIHDVQIPALIIWGDMDSYLPVKDGRFMHEQLEGSELRIIKGGRHGIHRTFAEDIAGWIKDFLNK